ncbi:MAG: TIGR01777 family oxidoreductase [Nocardioidaceae bacterium]
MKILAAGTSGFLGTALRARLGDSGHEVTQLVRSEPHHTGQVGWNPARRELDRDLIESHDVVLNLAGAPIAHWPWTSSYRRELLESRVSTTGTLAEAIAASQRKPALVNASGIDYYGHGPQVVDEDSPSGNTFLAGVCREWEAATAPAAAHGARVAIARTAVALDRSALVLKLISLPVKVGLGARLGSGEQWFATVSLEDYLAALTRMIVDDSMSGPYNVVAPVPATNAEFTEALGEVLHRPTWLVAPRFALKIALGGLADLPLGSIHAQPRRLMEAGFTFAHPTIREQLAAAYDRSASAA